MTRLLTMLGLMKPEPRMDLAQAEAHLRSYGIGLQEIVTKGQVPIRMPGTTDAAEHYQEFSDLQVYESGWTGKRRLSGTYYNHPLTRAGPNPNSGENPGKVYSQRFNIAIG